MESPCALILGASGVLGSAMSQAFQEKGYQVIGTGFKHLPQCQSALQIDATISSEMPRFEKWLREKTSQIDVVISCIGATLDGLIFQTDPSRWETVIDTNLKSAFLISKVLLPILCKQRAGHLIWIGSWAGKSGREGQSNYAAAKAALVGFSKSIAREYASRKILSNCILPGVFQSSMTEKLSAKAMERIWKDAVLKEFASPQETALFVAHLASMKGVTGQVFQLDGRIGPN